MRNPRPSSHGRSVPPIAGPRRVFLSHTSELREFPPGRSFIAAAEAAVSQAGDAVIDMAYFPARDDKPADFTRTLVLGCDLYVGLIGLRYGSPVRDWPEASYTELEFDTATEAGLPRLIFLLDEDAAVPIPPARLLDADPGLQARQQAFRARVLDSGAMSGKFSSPEQLEFLLLRALQTSRPPGESPEVAGSAPGLPALPTLVGRDSEVAALVAAWLATPPEPVAVLGAPGIGKSTICLAALHDGQVKERFGDRRWFIRCDGAQSAQTLLSDLAAELGVIDDRSPGGVADRVRAALGAGPAVVVLDNFETPWAADPRATEELLRVIAAIPQAGLAITARGTSRPAGLRWRDFAMVNPLPLTDARRLFLAVAGTSLAADPGLDELIGELDGVPLAVELIGYAAQGQPDLAEVVERWRAERSAMLDRMGGASRELSVPVSVEASVTSPLITPPARRLLSLLGVLPDGVAREDLTELLPGTGLAAASVLRQVGLAFGEGDRLRTLDPVREYIAATYPPATADLDRLVSYYAQLAATLGDQVGSSDSARAAARLQAEIGNITTMMKRAAADDRIDELAGAVYGLANYWRFTRSAQPAILSMADRVIEAHGSPAQRVLMGKALAGVAFDESDRGTARGWYERALPPYQQAGDVLDEAGRIKGLGDIALIRSDHDSARAWYEQALVLYRQAGDVLGEANSIQRLGEIALARSDHDSARAWYEQALVLYRQAGDVLGEANSIQRLGDIALARSDHDSARAWYEQALVLYRRVLGDRHPDTLNTRQALAYVLQAGGDLDAAEAEYRVIIDLQGQALGREHPSTLSTRHDLAELLQLQGKWDQGEQELQAAPEARALSARTYRSLRSIAELENWSSEQVLQLLEDYLSPTPQLDLERLQAWMGEHTGTVMESRRVPHPSSSSADRTLSARSYSNLRSIAELENWSSEQVLQLIEEHLSPDLQPDLWHHSDTVSGDDWQRLYESLHRPD
jgi:tetratricopeptide (TPR) repeat protein